MAEKNKGIRPQASVLALSLGVLFAVEPTRVPAAENLLKQQLDCLIEPRVTIKLGAEVAGLIEGVDVDRGDHIKLGQVVARLKSGVEDVNFALAKARAANDLQVKTNQARAEFLRRKASRQAELRLKSAVAESTYDEANTDAAMGEFAMQEAELNWQVAKLEVTHQEELLKQRTILSPINGVVVERALSAGEYTNETKHILTIAQIDPLNVEVFVPISYYGQTAVGTQAEVFPEEPIGGRHLATVTVIDHVLDAASGTFGVRLQLANPDYVIPAGINCKIRFTGAPAVLAASGRSETDELKADKDAVQAKAAQETGSAFANRIEQAATPAEQPGAERVAAENLPDNGATATKTSTEQAAAEKPTVATVVAEAAAGEQLSSPAKPAGEGAGSEKNADAAPAQRANENKDGGDRTGALSLPEVTNKLMAPDLSIGLQQELRRVGCNPEAVDGNWNAASQRALELFNRYAGLKLDTKLASSDALDAVRSKTGRICPLVCKTGFQANGDQCTRIVCGTGYGLINGICEKLKTKKPGLEKAAKLGPRQRAQVETAPVKPQVWPRVPSYPATTVSGQKMNNRRGQQ
jgi:RND family efflux transporter MFP subunit